MASELRRPAPAPDLDAEEEIDLGRYATAVASRWWLLVLGTALGAIVGYLISLGGSDVYRAQALIDLGEPLAPGGTRVTGLATPGTVNEIVRSEAVVRRVAAKVGLTPAELRRGISVQSVSGSVSRVGEAPLVRIGVNGEAPGRIAAGATELARIAVDRVSPYVKAKIASLEAQIAAADRELASLDSRIEAASRAAEDQSLSSVERLIALTNAGVLEQRRAIAQQTRSDRVQQLALAEEVERPRLLERAAAAKVTARSRRNSIVVAAVIGLLIGLIAALVWDRVAGLRRPSP
jgi:uncharacterized protein involved in exopolysaccharide biosynthesis